jgi:hypothetical protein
MPFSGSIQHVCYDLLPRFTRTGANNPSRSKGALKQPRGIQKNSWRINGTGKTWLMVPMSETAIVLDLRTAGRLSTKVKNPSPEVVRSLVDS